MCYSNGSDVNFMKELSASVIEIFVFPN
jgi:hypothetical protein